MGKTYIDTVKYLIVANVEIKGIVEKPDVVGAIFGQTEGLLGDELDIRELQRSGKIGRIDVDLKVIGGKSIGKLIIPCSLDKIETAIVAATVETVDRIGPCEASIKIEKIEDTRNSKRIQVINRAKDLIKQLTAAVPERKEISELIREEVKTSELQEYGPEKLACGPNIDDADHLIVVEGRADVINLLKYDIKNVIALQGSTIPKTIIELSKRKTITVFVDGDRGGDLIVKQLMEVADIDYVAKAPDGKEVEELTQKEILKCLRRKVSIEEFSEKVLKNSTKSEQSNFEYERPSQIEERQKSWTQKPVTSSITRKEKPHQKVEFNEEESQFLEVLKALSGTLTAILLDENLEVIKQVEVKDLSEALEEETKSVYAVVFDGIITQRLLDIAKEKEIKYVVGMKKGKIEDEGNVIILTLPS
ncbi:MAG: DNA primase DnaG [archaeon]